MSGGSYVDSGQEVSWNGSMCTVFLLDAEPTAALAWKADPFDAPNSLFPLRWRTILPPGSGNSPWVISATLSGVFPPGPTSCE